MLNWNKMPSGPGSDEGNEKHRAAFDAWHRQESVLNAAARNWNVVKMSFSSYFIIGSPLAEPLLEPIHHCVSVCECERHCITSSRAEITLYLALNLPRFGDGRQVTSSHHHGPTNTTHHITISTSVYTVSLSASASVRVLTWQSLCVWSLASCTWSSRPTSHRS